jgi:rhamnose transport system ATP-binding protein
MDEPTASLTDREVARLFEVIARMRRDGAGVIYISHRLDEVLASADRITVLRDGETVLTGPRETLTRDEVVRAMAGRHVGARDRRPSVTDGDHTLEVRGLTSRTAGVHDVSLRVRRGEILGIAGLVGSGRTELAETVFGLHRIDRGTVLIGGEAVTVRSPEDAIRHGLAYVPEDRRRHGVVLDLSVAANTSLACLAAVSWRGLVRTVAERELAGRFVTDLHIRTPGVDAEVSTLSGGNQQKVALARWLATKPSVLILDEPTQGVDVGAKTEIHGLIQQMAADGLAVVMISSELPEILALSDRIAVMAEGTIRATVDRQDATAETILDMALAGPPAPAAPV